jgi:predicted nucleic acid-binding protein
LSTIDRLILDAGALIAVERNPGGKVQRACERALKAGAPAFLPTVVLAQVWRASARQAPLAKIRKVCRAVPFSEEIAEEVGRLLGLTGTSDVVDASVVTTAIMHNCVVLTSDPGDLRKLADAAGVRVPLIAV